MASIFGSGFLVIVPILNAVLGPNSWIGMLLVCILAYMVGSVIRNNISKIEPLLQSNGLSKGLLRVEKNSDVVLYFAYCISVSLYLHVMVSFFLAGIGSNSIFLKHLLVCVVIIFIGAVGWYKGLEHLSFLEKIALFITTCMIVLIIAIFMGHNISLVEHFNKMKLIFPQNVSYWDIAAVLGGSIIVIQGFETSRYLGGQYSSELRIKSCRFSQIFTSIVYLLFILALTPWLYHLHGVADDNGLFYLIDQVIPFLAIPLVCVAVLSQFSAALADTIAGGENLIERKHHHVDQKNAYLRICGIAIIFSFVKTYTILVLASKAFALYYVFQTYLAYRLSQTKKEKIFYGLIQLALIWIIIFARPVG